MQKLQDFALQPMEISKRYHSVPVKDNCALFAPTPYFPARAIRRCNLNFPLPTPVAMATNFETKLTMSRLPQKNCTLFSPTPIFVPGLCNGVMQISPLN